MTYRTSSLLPYSTLDTSLIRSYSGGSPWAVDLPSKSPADSPSTFELEELFFSILGVVLQAPIASLVMWLDESKKEITLKDKDMFSNINKIQAVRSRIFMMHGNQDSIVNIRHSRMLYEKYVSNTKQHKIWYFEVTNTDHNDLEMLIMNDDCELHDKISLFIEELEGVR